MKSIRPLDVQPIEWLLLTTVAVQTAEDARERVAMVRVSLGY